MAKLSIVTDYLDTLLDISRIPDDSSNNGLQVEGAPAVRKIVFAVDFSLELATRAADMNADMIFVHHGISWGQGFRYITGIESKRLARLMEHGISLYAAHLPLDAHPEIGHNAIIAKQIGLKNRKMFAEFAGINIGIAGELPKALGTANLANLVEEKTGITTEIFGTRKGKLKKVGVISGAAGNDGISAAAASGLDCLVTGEIGHASWHLIQETGVAVIAGGHYDTEKPGVLAVMDDIESMFDVECEFIDIPTGL